MSCQVQEALGQALLPHLSCGGISRELDFPVWDYFYGDVEIEITLGGFLEGGASLGSRVEGFSAEVPATVGGLMNTKTSLDGVPEHALEPFGRGPRNLDLPLFGKG